MKFVYSLVFVLLVGLSYGQDKNGTDLKVTFDCADANLVVTKSNLLNCHSLVVKGKDAKNYTIISTEISMKMGKAIKVFTYMGKDLSPELKESIKKLNSGEKIILENPRAIDQSKNAIVVLPTSKLIIK